MRIKTLQKRISDAGFGLGDIDGFWGPKSTAACQAYLRSLMPKPNPWPTSDEASLARFYGKAGDESQLVTIEFPYPMFYEGSKVTKTRCHRKVAESLIRVLMDVRERHGLNEEVMRAVTDYGGIYNNRAMRGGSRPSLHARGAAIDLDADRNGNLIKWPEVATMPIEIMECFAREGWLSAGAFWSRDGMHQQATA
jgi:hypothetical protein